MRLYKTKTGMVIEKGGLSWRAENEDWDLFVNDDGLHRKMLGLVSSKSPFGNAESVVNEGLLPPIHSQELWAAGVTYVRSKIGRQAESEKARSGDFYARVYEAERPELFFKAGAHRVVGAGMPVRIRKDSTWNVPEPELTLFITSHGKIVGYTIGNDMSSRSIEGENPLYLPQAKTYDGCASLGPCIYVPEKPLPAETVIHLEIAREGTVVFAGSVEIGQMKRTPEALVTFLFRECSFPHGALLMTGTGIVPSNDFTLQLGDKICITIDPIGTLENTVA